MGISFHGTSVSAGLSFFLAVSASITPATAQSAPEPSASSAAPAPAEPISNEPSDESRTDDAVVLKTGAAFRGIIFELVPGDHVAIQLPTGVTKQFAMSDVRYAGPASEMPKESATQTLPRERRSKRPPAAPSPDEYTVRLVAGQPDVTFWVERRTQDKLRSGGFHRLCSAPCEASLPAGRYRFALAQSGGAPRTAGELVTIAGDATVRGDILSRAERRTGGWVIAGVGGAGGLLMLLAAPNAKLENRNLLTGFGIGCIVGATVIGLPLGLSSDVVVAKSITDRDVDVRDTGARLAEGTDAARGISWTTSF